VERSRQVHCSLKNNVDLDENWKKERTKDLPGSGKEKRDFPGSVCVNEVSIRK